MQFFSIINLFLYINLLSIGNLTNIIFLKLFNKNLIIFNKWDHFLVDVINL